MFQLKEWFDKELNRMRRRAFISIEDALYFGIRRNATPREKRGYPVKTGKY